MYLWYKSNCGNQGRHVQLFIMFTTKQCFFNHNYKCTMSPMGLEEPVGFNTPIKGYNID